MWRRLRASRAVVSACLPCWQISQFWALASLELAGGERWLAELACKWVPEASEGLLCLRGLSRRLQTGLVRAVLRSIYRARAARLDVLHPSDEVLVGSDGLLSGLFEVGEHLLAGRDRVDRNCVYAADHLLPLADCLPHQGYPVFGCHRASADLLCGISYQVAGRNALPDYRRDLCQLGLL